MSKVAWVFPGQGAQKAGMGKDFYEKFPIARDIYDQATKQLGFDVPALCFTGNDKLDLTEYTQVALVTTCIAIARVMESKRLEPDITAGLSLGEYCAIALAGGMQDEEAILTVRERGLFMQNALPAGVGKMAVVLGMDKQKLLEVINPMEGVTLANENCPGQLVITGYVEAVQNACDALREAGAKRTIPLQVSGAFHSPLQEKAGEQLYEVLRQIEWQKLKKMYVTNVTGDLVFKNDRICELLREQVSAPVLWQKSVETMILEGVDTFVEIGPGTTLSGCIRKIDRNVQVYHVGSVEDMEDIMRGELLCRQEK